MQQSANQYGSIDSGNSAISQIPNERSVTPFLQDFMDPGMCYLPNGYPSYYYGGMLICMLEFEYSSGFRMISICFLLCDI